MTNSEKPGNRQPSPFLTPRQLCERLQCNRHHLGRLMRQQGMPKPLILSPRCRRWRLAEIEQWEQARAGAAA